MVEEEPLVSLYRHATAVAGVQSIWGLDVSVCLGGKGVSGMICVVLVGGVGCRQTLDETVRDKVASEGLLVQGASRHRLDETASAVKSEPGSVSLALEIWSMAPLWRFVDELLRKKGP